MKGEVGKFTMGIADGNLSLTSDADAGFDQDCGTECSSRLTVVRARKTNTGAGDNAIQQRLENIEL